MAVINWICSLNILMPNKMLILPAEEMFMIKKGANCGWPYCYFDVQQNKKVLAPEYGGDGKKQHVVKE
jgi:hypothetical protein